MSEAARKNVIRLLWTYTGVGVGGLALCGLLLMAGSSSTNGETLAIPGAVLLVCSIAVLLYAAQQWALYFWNRRK
jgi:hypothetical protein